MLKAFVICVVAGLGQVRGAVVSALVLGLMGAANPFAVGVQYSFAIQLGMGMAVLI